MADALLAAGREDAALFMTPKQLMNNRQRIKQRLEAEALGVSRYEHTRMRKQKLATLAYPP
jgi:hypothetical protein